jgi:hypothetical protein
MHSPIRFWNHAIRPCRIATLLLALCGVGCQSWHTQQLAPEAFLAVRHPTQLRITMADGSQVVIEQPELQGDTLVGIGHGQRERVPVTDIRALATRGDNPVGTLALIVAGGAVAYAAFLVIFLSNCGGCH